MAKHKFGILQNPPKPGERYDEYEPQKYDSICVDDDILEKLISSLDEIDFYWHTIDVKGKGLAYCGITLIPPDSTKTFIKVIENTPPLSDLRKLSEKALSEDRWMIHFGL